jgi:aminopeptidase N
LKEIERGLAMRFGIFAAIAAMVVLAAPSAAQTQEQAVRLTRDVRPISYDLTVTPNAEALTLQGQVSIALEVAAPTSEIVLDAVELDFDNVTLDGRPATSVRMQASDQTAHMTFARPITAGRHTLAIAYRGKIYRQAQGLFAQDYDIAGGGHGRMLVSQFEAADARRFLPCFDEPAFRATFDLTVIAPQPMSVISNMPEANSENMTGGMKRVRFATTPAMSSYLLFLGVGDFERISETIDGVLVSIVTKRGDAERGRFALNAMREALPWLNQYFGARYPLPKLDIIAAPGGGGFAAMENWGAILFFEQYLLVDPDTTTEARRQFIYTTLVHETAHMWFGDLVTMDWWDDIWLNEGFATWVENKATNELHPEWAVWDQAQGGRQGAMLLDARPSSHPIIVPIMDVEQANQAFDSITYQKGYAVIRMLEEYVGADSFRNGVRAYIRQHAYGNTHSAQLWDAIEAASDQPIRTIADEFTRQPGVPLIGMENSPCTSGRQSITLHQGEFTSLPVSRQPLLWHTPVTLAPLRGGPSVRVLTGDARTATTTTACGPQLVNPGQIGYYRVQYPRSNFDAIVGDFAHVPTADQLGVLYDTRALSRAGQAPASDMFALARSTPRNADPLVWGLIASELAATDSLYSSNDPRRTPFRRFARDLLNPVFARVGWARHEGESDNTSILRAGLIGALSQLQDPRFEAEALRRYRASDIDGRVRAGVLAAVAAAATPQVFDDMLAHARAATDTLEKRTFYFALANTRDRALATRVLEIAFDADVAPAFGPNMILTVAGNFPELAYDYAATHETELAARLDPFSLRAYLPSVAVNSNDPAMLPRLRRLIDDSIPPTARGTPEASYAQLNEKLSTRERRLSEISAWLSQGRAR